MINHTAAETAADIARHPYFTSYENTLIANSVIITVTAFSQETKIYG
jgi:hypothetical protein